jgi:hypothetical protein
LNEYLLAECRRGKQLVVVIDEAQNLPDPSLELLRMLSNFETPREKLMQIILAGQPQLEDKLASPHLVQLRQRISIVARLKPFTLQETNLYVGHRLQVAGYDFRASLFTQGAGAMVAEHSDGIPRNINNICFNALSLGCALKRKPIDEEIIREVLHDLGFGSEELGSENAIATTIREPEKPTLKASTNVVNAGMETHRRVWLSRCATAAMLFLMLMWLLGGARPNTKVFASETSPATASNAAQPSSRIISVSPSAPDSKASEVASKESAARKSTAPESNRSVVAIDFNAATRSPRRGKSHATETDIVNSEIDPAELWRQVGNESTRAEVALAKLYLDGVVVPQNCLQAQVLLLAASKKRYEDVKGPLDTYEKRCQ